MPFVLGLLLRGLGKFLSAWWIPLMAVVVAWIAEATTGVIAWGLYLIAQAVGDLILSVLESQTWPSTPDWAVLTTELETGIALLSEAGIIGALQIVVLGGIVRLTVRLLTLGRL